MSECGQTEIDGWGVLSLAGAWIVIGVSVTVAGPFKSNQKIKQEIDEVIYDDNHIRRI